jgi:hypothetical protein
LQSVTAVLLVWLLLLGVMQQLFRASMFAHSFLMKVVCKP